MNQSIMSCEPDGRIGMVQATAQQLHEIYPMQTALRQGTLFPELDKPCTAAPQPTASAQPTARQEHTFTAWELRLYLDTHPTDTNALQLFEQLAMQMETNASAFVNSANVTRWEWTEGPWPWELADQEKRSGCHVCV